MKRLLVSGLFLIVTLVIGTAAQAEVEVAYWPMDEITAGVTPDESGYEQDGIVGGNTIMTTDAVAGNALEFDGNGDYIRVESASAGLGNLDGRLAIEFWLNMHTTQHATLIGRSNYEMAIMVEPYSDNTTGVFRFYVGGTNFNDFLARYYTNDMEYYIGKVWSLNDWNHFRFTYDFDIGPRCYVNGIQLPPRNYGVNILGRTVQCDSCATYIGRSSTGSGTHNGWSLDGALDEVSVYNTDPYVESLLGELAAHANDYQNGYNTGYTVGKADGEALHANDYQNGYNTGYGIGKADGEALHANDYNNGYADGEAAHADDYNNGYADGEEAHANDYQDGYNVGYLIGKADGEALHANDYQNGYIAGYAVGYGDGWNALLAKLPPGIRDAINKAIGFGRDGFTGFNK